MSKLLSPVQIAGLDLKNRVVMPPMCMYDVQAEDGLPTSFHHAHYGARAIGGVGLIIQEATAVTPEGRLTKNDLGLWNDAQGQALAKMVSELHQLGTKVGVQLCHAGRKAKDATQPLAPTALDYDDQGSFKTPKEMTLADIEEVKAAFVAAAKRAEAAGYDMLQLHGAHGYLINQFLEPMTNHRQDAYGGSLAARFRFLKEVVAEVKAAVSLPIWVRLSVSSYAQEGTSLADYQTIARWLEELGVACLDISTGGVLPLSPNFPIYGGYQANFSAKIKAAVEIPVTAVGLIKSPELAEYLLQNDQADLIEVGRELIAQPNWPAQAAKQLHDHDFSVYNHSYQRGIGQL
ncbi:tRNA-dihydrouridine synthase [Ligilactobacillus equi]|nr:tRNA-dihydrouridine synthase [Ligilactobacillus equi]